MGVFCSFVCVTSHAQPRRNQQRLEGFMPGGGMDIIRLVLHGVLCLCDFSLFLMFLCRPEVVG